MWKELFVPNTVGKTSKLIRETRIDLKNEAIEIIDKQTKKQEERGRKMSLELTLRGIDDEKGSILQKGYMNALKEIKDILIKEL